MNKRILGCMAAVFLTFGATTAQNVQFGLRAGLNLPNITGGGNNTPVSEGYASRLAAGAGVFSEVRLSDRWSARFGVEYSGQGGKKDGLQAMPTSRLINELTGSMAGIGSSPDLSILQPLLEMAKNMPYFYANINNTVKFDYVMIPLLAQYNIGLGESPWSVYVNAGPFVSFLVSGKQVSEGNTRLYADASGRTPLWDTLPLEAQTAIGTALPEVQQALEAERSLGTTNITGEMKSTNFGVTGNVGIRYQCGRSCFLLEGGGNYGLITVQQDDTNGSNRLGAASVMLGYAFSFF
ncbi:MAG: PorT family protein [Bacteroidales bacterium]|jgi:hypothetical protein|nr:PorT family protein [Bacteroidales bacterium]